MLRYEDLTGVVLVGWSYGGMIVAGVADRAPERIAHLVYLDSDVPRDGDTSAPPARTPRWRSWPRRTATGWRVPPDGHARRAAAAGRTAGGAAGWIADAAGPAPGEDVDAAHPPDRRRGVDPDHLRPLHGRLRPDRHDTRRQDERIRSEPTGITWSWPRTTPRRSRRRGPWPICWSRSPEPLRDPGRSGRGRGVRLGGDPVARRDVPVLEEHPGAFGLGDDGDQMAFDHPGRPCRGGAGGP